MYCLKGCEGKLKKIMVVDNHDQIFTIKEALEHLDQNYKVIGVEDGEQCLKLLENGEIPDIILSETRMQGMNGWQLFNVLTENPEWRHIPKVFVTAWEDTLPEDKSILISDEHIQKPFDVIELKRKIDKYLER
jgi:CheY-like chemotaxis protein